MKTCLIIPCHNEEKTIAKVINDFRDVLNDVDIYVIDNASTDNTAAIAEDLKVRVLYEKKLGKGQALRKAFNELFYDIYIIVDGDDTYFANDVRVLLKPVVDGQLDIAVGRRRPINSKAMRFVNKLGNVFFSKVMSLYFKTNLSDVLSGYRVLNRKVVEEIDLITYEFEFESELTLQALSKGMEIKEFDVDYQERKAGSHSKLNVIKDGWMVLNTMIALFRDLRPLTYFSICAFALWIFSLTYGLVIWKIPREAEFLDNIIIISSFIVGWFFLMTGFVMHTIDRRFQEFKSLIQKQNK